MEYIFTDEKQLQAMKDAGKVIECRTYDTIYGPWSYFTADDGQIDLGSGSYLMMGTLESPRTAKARRMRQNITVSDCKQLKNNTITKNLLFFTTLG